MFCYQCEQTAKGTACTIKGVCGKTPEVAILQDLLTNVTKAISMYAHRARLLGIEDDEVNVFTLEALFTTVTNVNFDADRMREILGKAWEIKQKIVSKYEKAKKDEEVLTCPAPWKPEATKEGLLKQGECSSIDKRIAKNGADITGLQELLTYGIRGMAAYAYHAHVLGKDNSEIYAFIHEAFDAITKPEQTIESLFALNMRCGEISVKTLALLDEANTSAYGNPVPTQVLMGYVKGKAILVSGHDLKDLEELLKQTEGKGINIYTHGEMLPAHGYPELKKYKHLVGHFGGAWQLQRKEFSEFPGSILMTTNCIQEPKADYISRIFTNSVVAWPNVVHIKNQDFSPVIDAALKADGFKEDSPKKYHTVGFGHNAVLGVADKVIDAVKSGTIKRFMLVGGCDGSEGERNYYTDVVEKAPKDWVILTLGCGKYRVINSELGTIGELPRLLDMGQCNDSYSAIKVALELAKAFNTDVNSLPLSLVISWFEQKAVCVLLALLHLGVKNIRLGPKLPAFITPAVLNVLVEKFSIMPVGDADDDLKAMAS
ncbi:MAG: hydroxylamine reductase [Alphaproteobacteria bacterium]